MSNNIAIIIEREFKERVAKKSFIVTTLLMPVLMLLLSAAPALIMMFTSPANKNLAVIDNSKVILPYLLEDSSENLKLSPVNIPLQDAINDKQFDGVLVVGKDIVSNPASLSLYLHDASSLEMERQLTSIIKHGIEEQRLKNYNIPDLQQILKDIDANVTMSTIRIEDDGSESSTSSFMSFALGMGMAFILYIFLLMYGQMVMTSIIEEKNNRVLELMVSSVKPMHMMIGKIIGVGLVAVLQIAIWCALMCLISAFVLPLMLPQEMVSQAMMQQAGTQNLNSTFDPEMLQIISAFSSPGYIATLFLYVLLFLVGGFLFYASIFAAIGSAVDNVQDASQLTSFAMIPIMLAFFISFTTTQDPNSPLAFWGSIIPFTAPMVMLSRIPFNIASWQIWVSLITLYLSFVAMAWIAAKIYRVGIFMHGKKPTIKDLIRWTRYK